MERTEKLVCAKSAKQPRQYSLRSVAIVMALFSLFFAFKPGLEVAVPAGVLLTFVAVRLIFGWGPRCLWVCGITALLLLYFCFLEGSREYRQPLTLRSPAVALGLSLVAAVPVGCLGYLFAECAAWLVEYLDRTLPGAPRARNSEREKAQR